jgi:PKD repeat protein
VFTKNLLVAALLCLFCINGFADETEVVQERSVRQIEISQQKLKLTYKRQKKAYQRISKDDEAASPVQIVKSKANQAQSWFSSQWKKVKKQLRGRNQRNVLPILNGISSYAVTSGSSPVFNFSTYDELEDPDGEVISVDWNFGDGTSMNIPREELDEYAYVSHIFPAVGTYNVKVRVYDNDGEYSEVSNSIVVTNNQAPTPNFTATPQTGNIVDFSADAHDPENAIVKYTWRFDDGSPSQSSTVSNLITHEFPSSGVYNVRLDVFDAGGARTRITKKVYVATAVSTSDAPYPIVQMNTNAGTGPLVVNFDASLSVDTSNAAVTDFEWDFGDFDSVYNYSTDAIVTHSYKAPGVYTGRLLVRDTNNNEKEYYFSIYVKGNTISTPHIIAQQKNGNRGVQFISSALALNATLDPDKVFWNFGDGHTDQGLWSQHKYAINGNYTVRLVAHDIRGVRHTVTHELIISNQKEKPQGYIDYNENYQNINEAYSYTAGGTEDPQQHEPLKYYWNFGDGTIAEGANLTNVSHQFSTRGYHFVKLYLINSRGFTNGASADIMVQEGAETRSEFYYSPRMSIGPKTVHFDSGYSYSDGSTIVKRIWQMDDDTYITSNTFTKTFHDPGYYFVKLYTLDALGNESVVGHPVIILDASEIPPDNLVPVASFKITYGGPNAGNLHFDASNSRDDDGYIEFYEWTIDGAPDLDGRHLWKNLTEGTHTVKLTVRDNWNSRKSMQRTFKVGATKEPVLNMVITSSTPNKLEQIDFDGSSSIVTGMNPAALRWDFGDGNTARGQVVHHVYAIAGTYTVKLSATDLDGQVHSITQELIVSEP